MSLFERPELQADPDQVPRTIAAGVDARAEKEQTIAALWLYRAETLDQVRQVYATITA
jgi:hypothetical protein